MDGNFDELDKQAEALGIKLPKVKPVPKILPTANPFEVESLLDEVQGALSSQESRGNTKAVNRRTSATGEFQVLPSNIPSWTKNYLGQSLTPEQFKANPDAQRKVFRGEFGKYLTKALPLSNGDKDKAIRMAAAAWYGGEGAMNRYDDDWRPRPDEPSFREYTSSVLGKIRKGTVMPSIDFDALDNEFAALTGQTDFDSLDKEFQTLGGQLPTVTTTGIGETPQDVVDANAKYLSQPNVPTVEVPPIETLGGFPAIEGIDPTRPVSMNGAAINQVQPKPVQPQVPPQKSVQTPQSPTIQPTAPVVNQPVVQPERTSQIAEDDFREVTKTLDYQGEKDSQKQFDFVQREFDNIVLQSVPNTTTEDIAAVKAKFPIKRDDSGEVQRRVSIVVEPGFLKAVAKERDKRVWVEKKKDEAETLASQKGIPFDEAAFAVGLLDYEGLEKSRADKAKDEKYRKAYAEKREADLMAGYDPLKMTGYVPPEDYKAEAQKNVQQEIDRLVSEYGSVENYYKERNALWKRIAANPNSAAVEFTTNLVRTIPKGISNALKSISIGSEILDTTIGQGGVLAPYLIDRREAKDRGFFQIGKWIDQKTDEFLPQDEQLKKAFILNTLPDALGQLFTQIGVGIATGGVGAPLLLGASAGAAEQYEEADRFKATKGQKLLAATVGAIASAPDILPIAKWIKPLTATERAGFFTKLVNSMFGKASAELSEAETISLARQFIKNSIKGGLFEGAQEVSENKINDALASLTYDKKRKVFTINGRDLESFFAGFIGGSVGGTIQTTLENKYELDNLTTRISPEQVVQSVDDSQNGVEKQKYQPPESVKPSAEVTAKPVIGKGEGEVLDIIPENKAENTPIKDETEQIAPPVETKSDVQTPVAESETPKVKYDREKIRATFYRQKKETTETSIEKVTEIDGLREQAANILINQRNFSPTDAAKYADKLGGKRELQGFIDDNTAPEVQEQKVESAKTEKVEKVFNIVKNKPGIHFDDILKESGLSFSDVNSALVRLDLDDRVTPRPGNQYAETGVAVAPIEKTITTVEELRKNIEEGKRKEVESTIAKNDTVEYQGKQFTVAKVGKDKALLKGRKGVVPVGDLRKSPAKTSVNLGETFTYKGTERVLTDISKYGVNVYTPSIRSTETIYFEDLEKEGIDVERDAAPDEFDRIARVSPEWMKKRADIEAEAEAIEIAKVKVKYNQNPTAETNNAVTKIFNESSPEARKIYQTAVADKTVEELARKTRRELPKPEIERFGQKEAVGDLRKVEKVETEIKSLPKQTKRETAKPSKFGGKETAESYTREKFGKERVSQIKADLKRVFKMDDKQADAAINQVYPYKERLADAKALVIINRKKTFSANAVFDKTVRTEIAERTNVPEDVIDKLVAIKSLPYYNSKEGEKLTDEFFDRERKRQGEVDENELPDEVIFLGNHYVTRENIELNRKRRDLEEAGQGRFTDEQGKPLLKISDNLAPNGKPSNLSPKLYDLVRTKEFKRWFGDFENDPENASKVVDENGEPLAVYHGTNAQFEAFDKNRLMSASGRADSGHGFYFTSSKQGVMDSSANWYGKNILAVFLNIRKPLELSEKTEPIQGFNLLKQVAQLDDVKLGESNAKTIYKNLRDLVDGFDKNKIEIWGGTADWLTHIGYEYKGKDYTVYNATKSHSLDEHKITLLERIARDIVNERIPIRLSEYGSNITDKIKQSGFDGVISDEYVVFEPTQIKSVDNIGTFDPDNPSILKKIASTRDKESARYQQELNERDLSELLPDVVSEVDSDTLKLSLEAGELIRSASALMNNSDLATEPNISGQFLNPQEVAQYKDVLLNYAEFAKDEGLDAKPINDLIKNLEKASAENGTVILNVFDEAVRHERFHQIGYLGAGEYNKTLVSRVADFKGFVKKNEGFLQQVYDSFFSKHGYDGKKDLDVIVEETATYLATGDYERLGIDVTNEVQMRAAHDYLYNWFDAYEKQNGNLALFEKFFNETEKASEIIKEVKNERQKEKAETVGGRVQESEVESGDGRTKTGEVSRADDGETEREKGRVKKSKTPQTLRENGIPLDDRFYTGATNAGQQEFADKQLNKGIESAEEWLKSQVDDGNYNQGSTTAVALSLMNHYGKTGEIDKLNKVADKIVPMLTEAGQAIQAVSLVSLFNPDTAGTYAAKVKKQKTGKGLTPAEQEKAVRIATTLSETAKADGVSKALLDEANKAVAELQSENDSLSETAKVLNNQNARISLKLSDLGKNIRNLKAQVKRLQDAKPKATRTPVAKVKREIEAEKGELEKLLADAFKDGSLRMVANSVTGKVAKTINNREWWHVPPRDESAYAKRGKFYTSSFREAEFYGIKGNATPETVNIQNPLIGDEKYIDTVLLGKPQNFPADGAVKDRLELDARLAKAAVAKGYDAIALLTPQGFSAFQENGKLPRSIELNTLELFEGNKNLSNTAGVEVYHGDSVEILRGLVDDGRKFDSVILDPAYFSKALVGGNRGIKQWEFITPGDFARVMRSVAELVKTDDTHVYLMLSGAKSAAADMQKYLDGATGAGFNIVQQGAYQKTFQDGKPVTNVRGEVAQPETIYLLTKSGAARKGETAITMEFSAIRPPVGKAYSTQKSNAFINALIHQSTLRDETVLDPFAGSGVSGVEASKSDRQAVLIDKSENAVKNFIQPNVNTANVQPSLFDKQILRKIAPEILTDAQESALVKLTALDIINGKSYADTIQTIKDRTKGSLSDEDTRAVHAEADAMVRGKKELTDAQKEQIKVRNEHHRKADAFAKRYEREADQIIKDYEKQIRADERANKATDKFTDFILRVGIDNDYSDAAVTAALARKALEPAEVIKALEAQFEGITKAEIRQALKDADAIYQKAKEEIRRYRIMVKEQIGIGEKAITRIEDERRTNSIVKSRAVREANAFYDGLSKSTGQVITETAVNYRKANLLSAIKTHLKNITGNLTFAASEEAERFLGAMADILLSYKTHQRTLQGISPTGIAQGFKNLVKKDETLKNVDRETGLRTAYNIIRYGDSVDNLSKQQLSESNLGEKVAGGFIADAYINFVFRTLSAEDALFKAFAYRRSIEEQAAMMAKSGGNYKQLITNPTNVMQEFARDFAEFSTFQNENKISNFISQAKGKVPYGVKAVFETLVPFDKTPTNIVLRVLEHTPYGLAKSGASLYKLAKRREKDVQKVSQQFRPAVVKDLTNEEFEQLSPARQRKLIEKELNRIFTQKYQREFASLFARGASGSFALVPLGYILAMLGIMSGAAADFDDEDRKEKDEAFERLKKGIEPGSVKIGSLRFKLPDTPVVKTLLFGATLYEQQEFARKEKKDVVRATVDGLSEATKDAVLEQPLLRQTKELYDNKKSIGGFTGNLLSGFIPASAMLRSISEVTDEEARKKSGLTAKEAKGKSFAQTERIAFQRQIFGGIPILRTINPVSKTTVPKTERGGWLRRLAREFDPVNTRNAPVKKKP